MTWQATSRNKITELAGWQKACACYMGIGGQAAPESTTSFLYGYPMYLTQITWSFPATNKLLLQAGGSFLNQTVQFTSRGAPLEDQISILDQIGMAGGAPGGYRYNALSGSTQNDNGVPQVNDNFNERFSASYITGSHALKIGAQFLQGKYYTRGNTKPNGLNYIFRGGVPAQLTQFATPFANNAELRALGVFVQDQWTLKQLTLNVGGRIDHFRGSTKDITVPAGPFVPERSYAAVKDIPNFKDFTPRIGVAYDIFGNGKTAIKGAWGRYLMGQGGGTTSTVSPANAVVISTTRTWADGNRNYVPDCVLTSLLANGECGPADNAAFGQARLGALTWAENARTGWGVREYNYQWNVSLQHELMPGLGVNVGFFRTDWRNQTATVSTELSASDYTSYCITAPDDPRLDVSRGKRICGLFDKNPNVLTRIPVPVLMLAKDVPGGTGKPKELFNGVDIALNGRFGKGGLVGGGVTLGRTSFDYCWNNTLPQVLQSAQSASLPRTDGFCNIDNPLWNGVGSQAKAQVVYPLPWDFVVSATYKNIPGIPTTASYTLTNAQVAPALGRNLATCPAAGVCNATATVQLLASANNIGNRAATTFDERLNEIDLRFTRSFRIDRGRIQAIAELYNVTNTRTAEAINSTYGTAAWLRPTAILGGRLFKFGAQIDF